jgi:hypothetical protein
MRRSWPFSPRAAKPSSGAAAGWRNPHDKVKTHWAAKARGAGRRTRVDFAEKFEALIETYNAGSRNIEQLYEELLKLSLSLDEGEQRHVGEI